MSAYVAVKLPLLIALILASNGLLDLLLGTGFEFLASLLASLMSLALAALDMGSRTREGVSIRAPLAGGDRRELAGWNLIRGFNPRPPCGGRQCIRHPDIQTQMFQSAPPLRGATS